MHMLRADCYWVICKAYEEKRISSFLDANVNFVLSNSLPDDDVRNRFLREFKKRWQGACRKRNRFEEKYAEWLNGKVVEEETGRDNNNNDTADKKRGRPPVDICNASHRTKKNRSMELVEENSLDELLNAAYFALRKERRYEDAKVIEQMLHHERNLVNELYSSVEELATLFDCRLSKEDYQTLRLRAKDKGSDLYPAYKRVR